MSASAALTAGQKGDANTSDGLAIRRMSSGARRSWVDFDGKPITPLPSPGIVENTQLDESVFRFPPLTERSQGEDRMLASSSAGSSSRQHARLSGAGSDVVNSPKTTNFFGTAWAPQPATLGSSKEQKAGLPRERQHPRFPSGSDTVFSPSRFPSATSVHPWPGRIVEDIHPSLQTLPTDNLNEDDIEYEGSTQSTPRLVLGTQPMVPSAVVSPPSPDPGGDGDNAHFGVSPGRRGFTRHTHGPSENATDSSILPKSHKSTREFYTGSKSDEWTKEEHSRQRVASSPQSTLPQPDESEDETTGRVGAYAVERVLGKGAFSRVVLARKQKGSDGLVALKMLEKEPCRQNERMRVSWVREVEVLKHIIHPSIVRFISSFSTNQHHVLVLESVEGGELFEYLAQEQLEISQREWLVRRIFGELAHAVGWMHTINLVHRDIKLENIILTRQLRSLRPLHPTKLPEQPLIKLTDFGLSRFIDPNAPHLETRCGSEEYAAPELIIGKRYDGRQTDVWAMGVVLYALLSGSLPFLSSGEGSNPSINGRGMANAREDSHESHLIDARARKSQLLRIAKGDLRWPSQANDECHDTPDPEVCPSQHRLITPPARLLVARLLRRDAAKRAAAWDVWDETWMRHGSFHGKEASAQGQPFSPPLDPRSLEGQAWLDAHARVQDGAPDVVHDD